MYRKQNRLSSRVVGLHACCTQYCNVRLSAPATCSLICWFSFYHSDSISTYASTMAWSSKVEYMLHCHHFFRCLRQAPKAKDATIGVLTCMLYICVVRPLYYLGLWQSSLLHAWARTSMVSKHKGAHAALSPHTYSALVYYSNCFSPMSHDNCE